MDYRAANVIEDPAAIEGVLAEGGFDGVVHAVGMLLANDLNRFASGSGSVPKPGTTYDQVRALGRQPARERLARCG